jgi:Putative transposase
MEQYELIDRLAPLIPPPRAHQVRYHGILAPCASFRSRVVPVQEFDLGLRAEDESGVNPPVRSQSDSDRPHEDSEMRPRRLRWAALLQRVFGFDALRCPRYGPRCGSSPRSRTRPSPDASSNASGFPRERRRSRTPSRWTFHLLTPPRSKSARTSIRRCPATTSDPSSGAADGITRSITPREETCAHESQRSRWRACVHVPFPTTMRAATAAQLEIAREPGVFDRMLLLGRGKNPASTPYARTRTSRPSNEPLGRAHGQHVDYPETALGNRVWKSRTPTQSGVTAMRPMRVTPRFARLSHHALPCSAPK